MIEVQANTPLRANGGWRTAGGLSPLEELLGVDRHGEIVSRVVRTSFGRASLPSCFLGARHAIARLPASTRIWASGSQAVGADRLSGSGTDGSLRAETPTLEKVDKLGSASIEDLLMCIVGMSVESSADRASLRARGKRLRLPPYLTTLDERLLILDCACLRAELRTKAWPVHLMRLAEALWWLDDESRFELPREAQVLLLTLLEAHGRERGPSRLVFDSRQHSVQVGLCADSGGHLPFEALACSFRSEASTPCVALQWDERSWSPIAGGFLIAPRA